MTSEELDIDCHLGARAYPLVKRLRWFVAAFIVATCISGLVILVMGFWIKIELDVYVDVTEMENENTPYVLVGIGAGIFFVGVTGCICLSKENGDSLYMFAVFLIVILIADVVVAGIALAYRDKLESHFEKSMKMLVHNYHNALDNKRKMDRIQTNMKCCGKLSYLDWSEVDWSGWGVSDAVPDSCCVVETQQCGKITTKTSIHQSGCAFVLTKFMGHNFMLMAAVAISASFLQLFGSMLACGLGKKISKYRYNDLD